jgi:hypothetical protein
VYTKPVAQKILPVNLKMYTVLRMVDKKAKTPDIVSDKIRAAILDGRYKPGEGLLEKQAWLRSLR